MLHHLSLFLFISLDYFKTRTTGVMQNLLILYLFIDEILKQVQNDWILYDSQYIFSNDELQNTFKLLQFYFWLLQVIYCHLQVYFSQLQVTNS